MAVACGFCHTDISTDIHIKCTECLHDVRICLQCFSSAVEFGAHLKTHRYAVANSKQKALFAPSWSSKEEIALMQALEFSGFGNWSAVADHVGNGRSPEECRQHYYRCYIDTPNKKLLPVPLAQRTDSAARIEPDEEDLEVPDTTSEHLDPKYRPKLSADFGGFSPIRLDYELEALPDAENLIADVTLHDDDTGPVRKLKLALLAAYAKRLRHRFECHRVAQEYGLCHAKSIDRECMESATLSRICHRLRPFARFHSAIDHKNLLRSFQRRAHFRHQILKLQRFRQVGCRTAEDCQNVDPQSDATALDGPNRKTVRQAHWQRLPYGHDLSKAELSLCQRLMLLPSIYASLKRARVLGTPLKDGIKLDKEKLLQVDSFFQQQGW